jgi:hypothetical protein
LRTSVTAAAGLPASLDDERAQDDVVGVMEAPERAVPGLTTASESVQRDARSPLVFAK